MVKVPTQNITGEGVGGKRLIKPLNSFNVLSKV